MSITVGASITSDLLLVKLRVVLFLLCTVDMIPQLTASFGVEIWRPNSMADPNYYNLCCRHREVLTSVIAQSYSLIRSKHHMAFIEVYLTRYSDNLVLIFFPRVILNRC